METTTHRRKIPSIHNGKYKISSSVARRNDSLNNMAHTKVTHEADTGAAFGVVRTTLQTDGGSEMTSPNIATTYRDARRGCW